MLFKQTKRIKRHKKIRQKIKGIIDRPRLSVFRSNKYLYLQLINDEKGKILVAVCDNNLRGEKGVKKIESAFKVGEAMAKKALEKKITRVIFDRGGYKYHGRVKAAAEGARKGGLQF